MKKTFSAAWNASGNRRKQRKFRLKAPIHIKRKFLGAHLSKDLQKKYNTRAISLRTGDRVKVMRGAFKSKEGKVQTLFVKSGKIHIDTIKEKNTDGTESFIPVQASNLMITTLMTEDKKRMKQFTGTKETKEKSSAEATSKKKAVPVMEKEKKEKKQ